MSGGPLTRHSLLAVVLGAFLVGSLLDTPATGQETPVIKPQLKVNERYSGKPADIVLNLTNSLIYMRKARAVAASATSKEQFNEAARLALEAYRMQRAAHYGIGQLEQRDTPGGTISQEYAMIGASRQNILMAKFRFDNGDVRYVKAVQAGLDYLDAAIRQTQLALAIHY